MLPRFAIQCGRVGRVCLGVAARRQSAARSPFLPLAALFRAAATLTWLSTTLPGHAQETARQLDYQGPVLMPEWTNAPAFKKDVFTFVRIKYSVDGKYGFGGTEERWKIDAPDSDLNFSYRLQQMTSMKVDPNGRVLTLTDTNLFNYPFIYIVEPGRLTFIDEEVPILRRYLLNGGFLMCDDFWGDREWKNFAQELKRVFPDREPQELPLDHPIFSCVFPLKEKPQVPGIDWFRLRGLTYEARRNDTGTQTVHYRAIFDDKGRIMVMLCHNTDLGDGWEREGENEEYFKQFSEKLAYPMGINIVYWAMTH
jgi:hypothetical protein